MGKIFIAALTIVFSVSLAHAGPLHDAAGDGDVERVRQLIAAGEDVNELVQYSGTPLHRAAIKGHLEVAELLVAEGAKVNEQEPTQEWTPLYMAALGGSESLAVLLIDYDAEISATDSDGNTPLHAAAQWGHGAVAKLLIASGADVNVRNDVGLAPIHLAALGDHFDVVKLLNSLGARALSVEPVSRLLISADPRAGEAAFMRLCVTCHTIKKGGEHDDEGPNLWGVIEREKASLETFRYTGAFARLRGMWTYEELNVLLASPADFAPGTTMSYFPGEKDAAERANLIAYLRENGDKPPPLPEQ